MLLVKECAARAVTANVGNGFTAQNRSPRGIPCFYVLGELSDPEPTSCPSRGGNVNLLLCGESSRPLHRWPNPRRTILDRRNSHEDKGLIEEVVKNEERMKGNREEGATLGPKAWHCLG